MTEPAPTSGEFSPALTEAINRFTLALNAAIDERADARIVAALAGAAEKGRYNS